MHGVKTRGADIEISKALVDTNKWLGEKNSLNAVASV
jgi:hypothetical protein